MLAFVVSRTGSKIRNQDYTSTLVGFIRDSEMIFKFSRLFFGRKTTKQLAGCCLYGRDCHSFLKMHLCSTTIPSPKQFLDSYIDPLVMLQSKTNSRRN